MPPVPLRPEQNVSDRLAPLLACRIAGSAPPVERYPAGWLVSKPPKRPCRWRSRLSGLEPSPDADRCASAAERLLALIAQSSEKFRRVQRRRRVDGVDDRVGG